MSEDGTSVQSVMLCTRITGKERDSESGLDHFQFRNYASTMDRWMSPDFDDEPSPVPYAYLANPQSLNLYSYMRNNPLSGRDADGHHQECDPDTTSTDSKTGTVTVTAGACREIADPPDTKPPSLFQRFMNWRQQQADAWNARIAANQKYALPDNELDKDFYGALAFLANLGGMDITNAGSQFPNKQLDMTQSEFGSKLESEGFTKGSTKDGSTQYSRDTQGGKEEVTMYPNRTSSGVPGGQIKVGGEIVGKLSFKP